jgi:hypothetical protein
VKIFFFLKFKFFLKKKNFNLGLSLIIVECKKLQGSSINCIKFWRILKQKFEIYSLIKNSKPTQPIIKENLKNNFKLFKKRTPSSPNLFSDLKLFKKRSSSITSPPNDNFKFSKVKKTNSNFKEKEDNEMDKKFKSKIFLKQKSKSFKDKKLKEKIFIESKSEESSPNSSTSSIINFKNEEKNNLNSRTLSCDKNLNIFDNKAKKRNSINISNNKKKIDILF